MKKKILIIHSSLGGGGAERVLIDIFHNFDYEKYDIDFLLLYHNGVYLSQIPPKVNLLTFSAPIFKGKLMSIMVRTNLFGLISKYKLRKYFKDSHYDTIISFMEGSAAKYHSYLLDKAQKNITWVHTDFFRNHYSKVHFPIPGSERRFYNKLDSVVFVSAQAKNQFKKLFAQPKGRVIYNLIDPKSIFAKAEENTPEKKHFTVCNIGRLCPQKRQDRIIETAYLLKQEGYVVDFWIIGAGELEGELKKQAKEQGVADSVHFLGFMSNPYPHLKSADVFLLTSDSEGFPIVVLEALCLSKPIISTPVTGPSEQLDNGRYGIIAEPDAQSIASAIKFLYDNPDELVKYQAKGFARAQEIALPTKIMSEIYNVIG